MNEIVRKSDVIDNLTTNSPRQPLSAAQGLALFSYLNGAGRIHVAADHRDAERLTGLRRFDIVHIVDDGRGRWERWQITDAGDGSWVQVHRVEYVNQDVVGGLLMAVHLGYEEKTRELWTTGGAGVVLPLAGEVAGLMSPEDKQKLDGISDSTPAMRQSEVVTIQQGEWFVLPWATMVLGVYEEVADGEFRILAPAIDYTVKKTVPRGPGEIAIMRIKLGTARMVADYF